MLHIKTKPRCYHPGANFPIIFGHPPMAQCTKQQSPVTKLHVHRTATAACKPPARREVVVPCADVPPMFRRRPDWLDAITTLGGRADRGLYGGELESAPPPRQHSTHLPCAQVVRDMPSSSGAEQGSKRFAHGESGEERPFRAAAHEGPVQTSVRVRASDGWTRTAGACFAPVPDALAQLRLFPSPLSLAALELPVFSHEPYHPNLCSRRR
jgi:hypothetical protein